MPLYGTALYTVSARLQEYDTVEQLVERIESDIKAEINNQKLMSK